MTPDEVAKSYDLLADQWNDKSFPRHNGIAQHQRAIAFTGNKRRALDIGCGSSGRIIDLMLNQGFDAEGLDISPRMVELARSRHPNIAIHQADICEWEFRNKYDFISAWDSIWHVPLAEQEQVLGRILAALAPGGVFIFTTGGVDSASETRDSAMGPPMYHSAPGIPAILKILAEADCVCRHLEYDQHPELHVYVIAQRVAIDGREESL